MAITFHCNHCGKKIEALDSAGGKWGKCPACHNKLYIPDMKSDEELKLSPVDEDEEKRKKQLMAETYKLEQDILLERQGPDEPAKTETPMNEANYSQLKKDIIAYLRKMADGQLNEAETIVNSIVASGGRAIEILDQIAISEIPEPQLADIPQQVLSGMIKVLRNKIS